jgi:hypothetical protein
MDERVREVLGGGFGMNYGLRDRFS